MPRPTVETEIGGYRFRLTYYSPMEALPVWGRLTAFLAPVLEGAAATALEAFLGGVESLDVDVLALAKSLDLRALLGGAFRVRWGDPEMLGLVREILGPVQLVTPQIAVPVLGQLDSDAFAGPAGLETTLRLTGWAAWKQFGLPFFSRGRASASPAQLAAGANPSGSPTS